MGAGHIQLSRFRNGPTPHPFSYDSGTPPAARSRVRAGRADTPAPGFERGCQELLAEVAITVTACSTA